MRVLERNPERIVEEDGRFVNMKMTGVGSYTSLSSTSLAHLDATDQRAFIAGGSRSKAKGYRVRKVVVPIHRSDKKRPECCVEIALTR